jgi:hypothetical protein
MLKLWVKLVQERELKLKNLSLLLKWPTWSVLPMELKVL